MHQFVKLYGASEPSTPSDSVFRVEGMNRANTKPGGLLRPNAVIVHTTGVTFSTGVKDAEALVMTGDAMAFDFRAVRQYIDKRLPYFGQAIVGQSGALFLLAGRQERVSHSLSLNPRYRHANWRDYARPLFGNGNTVAHGRDGDRVYDWWDARWPEHDSPVDLLGHMVPNNCLGVDFLPSPIDGSFADHQYRRMADLLDVWRRAAGIPVNRILGHEDVDPMGRGTVKKGGRILGYGWDPGKRFSWEKFREALASAEPPPEFAAAVL